MTPVEEYALWLAYTGVTHSAQDDRNEGMDPVTLRGEEMSDGDWRAATALTHQIAAWIRGNPAQVLRLVRGQVTG